MAGLGDDLVDLEAGELASLAGLCALGDLDLDFVGVDEVLSGDAEAAGRHLLDGGARRSGESRGVLASLAGVGAGAYRVHGYRHCLVGLAGDCAERHGSGDEALHDCLLRLYFLERNRSAGAEFEEVADENRLLFGVDALSVFLEFLIRTEAG